MTRGVRPAAAPGFVRWFKLLRAASWNAASFGAGYHHHAQPERLLVSFDAGLRESRA
jgi:hypothetical protein